MKIYVVGSSKNKFLPLNDIREKFLVDTKHDGDNIDFLNPWYCELTGLYYLWQHCTDDIVGLEHYRRYFVNDNGKLLSESEIKAMLTKYDVLAYKYNNHNAIKAMTNSGKGNELALALSIVHSMYGSNMASFLRKQFSGDHTFENNMFFCRKEILDKYCEFIFPVLAKFDTIHQFRIPRIDGYISEYMLGPWLEYNQYKIGFPKRIAYDKNLTKILIGEHV